MPDKVKEVYDLISDKGYFTDEKEFRTYVEDPSKRKEVFSLIKDDGYFTDEKEFESYFSDVKKNAIPNQNPVSQTITPPSEIGGAPTSPLIFTSPSGGEKPKTFGEIGREQLPKVEQPKKPKFDISDTPAQKFETELQQRVEQIKPDVGTFTTQDIETVLRQVKAPAVPKEEKPETQKQQYEQELKNLAGQTRALNRDLQIFEQRGDVQNVNNAIKDFKILEANAKFLVNKYPEVYRDIKNQEWIDNFYREHPVLETGVSAYNSLIDAVKTAVEFPSKLVIAQTEGLDLNSKEAQKRLNIFDDFVENNVKFAESTEKFQRPDGSLDWSKFFPAIGETVGTMAALIGGARVMGGGNAGLFASSYILTRDNYYQQAREKGLDVNDANSYADAAAGITSLLELVSPNPALLKGINKSGMLDDYVKALAGGRKEAAKTITKNIITKEILPENAQEIMQLYGDKITQSATDMATGQDVFNPEYADPNELISTVALTSAATLLMSGGAMVAENATLRKNAEVTLAKDLDATRATIDNMLANGQITEQQAQNVFSRAEKLNKAIKKIPSTIKPERVADTASLLEEKETIQSEIEGKDPALVEPQKQRIEQINNELKNIADESLRPTDEGRVTTTEERIGEPLESGKGEPTQEDVLIGEEIDDTKDKAGLPSEVGIRQEPIQAEPIQETSISEIAPSGVLETDEEVTQRVMAQMKPITDEMARVEMEFSNNGYKIDWDYDNEITVTDKRGELVESEDLPENLLQLAGQYEKATAALGNFDYNSYFNALQQSRQDIGGIETEFEEIKPLELAAPQASSVGGGDVEVKADIEKRLKEEIISLEKEFKTITFKDGNTLFGKNESLYKTAIDAARYGIKELFKSVLPEYQTKADRYIYLTEQFENAVQKEIAALRTEEEEVTPQAVSAVGGDWIPPSQPDNVNTFPLLKGTDVVRYIPESVAQKAWEVWDKEYQTGQSLQRTKERGGFGINEMDMFYPNWREESNKINKQSLQSTPAVEPDALKGVESTAKALEGIDVKITKDNWSTYLNFVANGGVLNGQDLIDLRSAIKRHFEDLKKPIDDELNKNPKAEGAYQKWKNETDKINKKYYAVSNIISRIPNAFGLEGDINSAETYHFTDAESILSILEEDKIWGEGETSGVSTTTNAYFDHPELTQVQFYGEGNKPITFADKGIRIDLNLDKIKEDKLRIRKGGEDIGTFEGEEEIRVGSWRGLENASKYINKIQVDRKIVDDKKYFEIKSSAEKLGIKVVEKTDYKKPIRKINSAKAISEAYHKAKADGSNPELVAAVEELLGQKVSPSVQVETKPQLEPDALKDVESTAKALEGVDTKLLENILGVEAYHRSPKKFNKFNISNASADANKQMAGYGLYFSDQIPNEQYGENLYKVRLFQGKKEYSLIDTKKPVEEKIVNKIAKALNNINKNSDELNEFSYNGFLFYKTLSRILGGDKLASTFLSENGVDGLKRNIGNNAHDYVLFNDNAISIDNNKSENVSINKSISEAYHKAKADGSNPELVAAVEELLGQKVSPSVQVETKPQLEPQIKSNLEKIQEETGTNFREIQNVYNKYGEGKPLNEITVEDYRRAEAKRQAEKEPTEKQIADTAQKAGITPKNLRDLYKINRELFGLDRIKSLASAIAMDRMVGVMAKRANITKVEMYGRLKFEKASEEFVKGLSDRAKVLWQIVGENAQLAQDVRDNLQVARDMEASGKDAKNIRLATGWEKGKDGKWRYEIPDMPMYDLNTDWIKNRINKFERILAGSLFDSVNTSKENDIFSLYGTKLYNIPVSIGTVRIKGEDYNGTYIKEGGNGFGQIDIRVPEGVNIYSKDSQEKIKSILLHEIQHAIQDIEGFAQGGSPSGIQLDIGITLSMLKDELIELEKGFKLIEENKKDFSEKFYNEKKSVIEQLKNRINKIEEIRYDETLSLLEKYKLLAGEVEARNVEKRMGMTPEQRRETLLSETEDVARDEQIVLFDSGGIQMQVDAWHGSPYQFDKFTTEKIGTGEGAQAFGWGLYFTDLEDIAKNYADKLSDWSTEVLVDDKSYFSSKELFPFAKNTISRVKAFRLIKSYGNIAQAISVYKKREFKNDNIANPEIAEEVLNLLESLSDKKLETKNEGRNLYKVSIHKGKSPDQYTWLIFDKPVSVDIKEKLIEKIEKENSNPETTPFTSSTSFLVEKINSAKTGGDLYSILSGLIYGDKNASLFLLDAGIDGIKYPAESISRGATSDTARGFNYVVFDENAVSIEEVIKFQKDAEKARGAMMIGMDGQAVIYALTDPNVSTPLHEMAHVFEHYMTDAEKAIVQSWAGTKGWTTQTSEKFARGFEKYLAEGKAPTSGLQKIFDKFKTWLTDIYNGITGSDIDIELNEPMREIYAQMLGAEAVKPAKVEPELDVAEVQTIAEKVIQARDTKRGYDKQGGRPKPTDMKSQREQKAQAILQGIDTQSVEYQNVKAVEENIEDIINDLMNNGSIESTDCVL